MPTDFSHWRNTVKVLARVGVLLAASGLCLRTGPSRRGRQA